MILNIDIYRAANVLVKQHGQGAPTWLELLLLATRRHSKLFPPPWISLPARRRIMGGASHPVGGGF